MNTIIIAAIATIMYGIFAYVAARNEAMVVHTRTSMGDRRDLDHSTLLLVRVIVVVMFVAGIVVFFAPPSPLVRVLLTLDMFVLAYGMFVPVHRFIINSELGHGSFYMSPGNNYDSHFLRRRVKPWPMYLRERYAHYYDEDERIRQQVHHAARDAYRIELTTFIIAWIGAMALRFVP